VVVRSHAARGGVAALLKNGFRLAAASSTPEALVGLCGDSQPDAVVIELDLNEHRERICALRRLHEAWPNARIVVIADPSREHDVRRALRAGADGFVLESEVDRTLAPTLCAVLAGQLSLPREYRRHVEKRALSYREQQVLALVIGGATNRQAAEALFLSESTVKGHLASAFAKLGVRSRAEATGVLLDPEAEPGQKLPLSVWPYHGAFSVPLNGPSPGRRAPRRPQSAGPRAKGAGG
jgi:DNA-binding NarL/FixJ family response regulator